jgi:multidrug efflux pump subunit AcrA (membrane-fusion protein)
MKRRYDHLAALAAAVLMFSGCGGEPERPKAPARVPARLLQVAAASVPSRIEVPGRVEPRNRMALSSQINGFVRTVQVQLGDVVSAGQVLATLDSRDAESQKAAAGAGIREAREGLDEAHKAEQMAASQRDAAKANARLAEGTLARFQKLFEARSVSPQELDEVRARRDAAAAELAARETAVAVAESRIRQIEARVAQADAQLQRADVVVSWTIVRAPSAGRVVERPVDPGSAIFPGSPILVLESVSTPQVVADVPTSQASVLKAGLAVQVAAEAGTLLEGRITEITPLSSAGSHSVRFKVDLQSGAAALSGSFARVLLPAGERQALLVPKAAIRETGQLTGVFVADSSSVARFRLVKVAPFDEDRIEVLSGIEPGERIVAGPTSQIADGVPLEIRT